MKDLKIALLIDVDNVKIGKSAFKELYDKLNDMGEVVHCKFYGYNDRKHLYLSELIAKYGYETAPFMRFKKRYSQLDTRILVDAVGLNYSKPDINAYCIVAGEGDLIPLLVELKSSARLLIDINSEYQHINTHMFDEHIELENIASKAEVYGTKVGSDGISRKSRRRTTKVDAATNAKQKAENILAELKVQEKHVEQVKAQEKPVEETMTKSLSKAIRSITQRYNDLDFDDADNMSQKLELISGMEQLIQKENDKGQGLFSENVEVREIFAELQDIVDDLKADL